MAIKLDQFTISGSVSTGTTAAEVLGSPIRGLRKYDWFLVDASCAGVPLGTLDVYLQRQVQTTTQQSGGVWADWIHFAQQAEGGARAYYSAQSQPAAGITVVGRGTDASPGTPALAASTNIGGHPGDAVRLVVKCSAATMTGTSIDVVMNCWTGDR